MTRKGGRAYPQDRLVEVSAVDEGQFPLSAAGGPGLAFVVLQLGWETFKAGQVPTALPCPEKVGNPHRVYRVHVRSAFMSTLSDKPVLQRKT